MTNYHLIGIGGSGLSAIALVLLESGHEVSGSDRQLSPQVQALQAGGARVVIGHRAEIEVGIFLPGHDYIFGDLCVEDDVLRLAKIG